MGRTNGNHGSTRKRMGREKGKGARLRLVPAILAVTIIISACGGSKSTYAETAAGAPAAVAEEIAYEDSMAYDTAAYDGGVTLNDSAKSASYE